MGDVDDYTNSIEERVAESDSNLVAHADRELTRMGMGPDSEDINAMMRANVLELMLTFSSQGHSGMSAGYCVRVFADLAEFRNLTPAHRRSRRVDRPHRHQWWASELSERDAGGSLETTPLHRSEESGKR